MKQPHTPSAIFGDEKQLSMELFSELDEENGRHKDYQSSLLFLNEYLGSKDTFTAYRREIERFLQWLWLVSDTTLPLMRREIIHEYMDFCQSPPQSWVGNQVSPRFKKQGGIKVPNENWRPFVSKEDHFTLSNNSKKALLSILSSYFNFLIDREHILFNPVALIRQKSRYKTTEADKPIIRRLTNEHWQLILSLVEKDVRLEVTEAPRALFIIASLYLMGLRISEIASDNNSIKMMSDFKRDHNKQWWFVATGKGNKVRHVPVNSDMLIILGDYRQSRQLTRLPAPGDSAPLLENFAGKHNGTGLSSRMIRYIVVAYFDKAVMTLQSKGLNDEAEQLSAATVHWLRHTSVSEQVKIRDKHHVQQDVGHRDSKTTDHYIDTFDSDRHSSMESFRLKQD